MRVGHVCPFVDEQMGGSERYVSEISKIQARHMDVDVFTTTRVPRRVGTEWVGGVLYHRFYAPWSIWRLNPVSFLLPSLIKAEVDLFHVHSHLYFTSNQAILAKLLTNRKSLLQLHGGIGPVPYKDGILKRIAKDFYDRSLGFFVINSSDFVASVSRKDLDYIMTNYRVSPAHSGYVPNAVDTNQFRPFEGSSSNGENNILFVGDFEYWKGIGMLAKWIKRLSAESNWDVVFKFVGQGSYEDMLQSLSKFLKRKKRSIRVEVIGEVAHDLIPQLMNEASALVLPSFWEGMPTVVLEAMATSTPIIATRAGDLPFLIESGENGILIDQSYDDFEEAVRRILSDEAFVREMGRKARSSITEQHSVEKVSQILEELYDDILGNST